MYFRLPSVSFSIKEIMITDMTELSPMCETTVKSQIYLNLIQETCIFSLLNTYLDIKREMESIYSMSKDTKSTLLQFIRKNYRSSVTLGNFTFHLISTTFRANLISNPLYEARFTFTRRVAFSRRRGACD